MDWNSIARTERNSLSFRQLVHPGCQNTFSGIVADMVASRLSWLQLRPWSVPRQSGNRFPAGNALRCHCEERSDAAISGQVRNWIEIASSLRSSQ
jgi:hypothetical protein